jgi:hypothetical protein
VQVPFCLTPTVLLNKPVGDQRAQIVRTESVQRRAQGAAVCRHGQQTGGNDRGFGHGFLISVKDVGGWRYGFGYRFWRGRDGQRRESASDHGGDGRTGEAEGLAVCRMDFQGDRTVRVESVKRQPETREGRANCV